MAALPAHRGKSRAPDALLHAFSLFVALLLVAGCAHAGSAALAWDPVRNSALAGYMVYYGPGAGNYTSKIDVGNATSHTVTNLTEGGTYHFAVTAYDASRSESGFSNDVSTIIPYAAPGANFTVSTRSGVAPLALNFTSTSAGSIAAYAWTFGDGASSAAANPSHLYSVAGVYAVSLTVTGPGGSSTKTIPNYVTVTPPATTSTTTTISATPNPSIAGSPVIFAAAVAGIAPTGTVRFTDNGVGIAGCGAVGVTGSGNVRSASCSTVVLATGVHAVVAQYSGDAANLSSTSVALNQVVTQTGIGVYSIVDHYYQTILGRAPDASGKAFWDGEIVRMQALGVDVKEAYRVMAGYFFNSPEYESRGTSNARYVTDLYSTFFNRAPDAGGLVYWTGQLASGLPRNIVLYGFQFSPEFNRFIDGLLGNTTSRAEVYAVVDFYRGILNRLPDTAGFDYWLGRFRAAQCSGTNAAGAVYAAVGSISSEFIASSEYANRSRSNTAYVSDLYSAFLRRNGDLAGVNYWIDRLDTGAEDRETLRAHFLDSPEFGERVRAMIGQGC